MTKTKQVNSEATHSLLFPHAEVIFGYTVETIAEATFEYCEETDHITFISVEGRNSNGEKVDLNHWSESPWFCSLILKAERHWDKTGDSDDLIEWWC